MIETLHIKSYGPIEELRCSTLGRINLLIGPNASGKTTMMKALYAALKSVEQDGRGNIRQNIKELLVDKLYWTFQADPIGELVRKGESELYFYMTSHAGESLEYSFGSSTSKKITKLTSTFGKREDNSVFIPAKEVLTIRALIKESRSDKFNAFGFDDTYADLANALTPQRKGRNIKSFADARSLLNEAIDGRLEYSDFRNDWVFRANNRQEFPVAITSEGIKKISILDVLLGNHYLSRGSVIFIDEPESALHPALISVFMDIIGQLAKCGIQFFIASHSYFVIKKLYLVAHKEKMSIPVISFADGTATISDMRHSMPKNSIIDESIRLYTEELGL